MLVARVHSTLALCRITTYRSTWSTLIPTRAVFALNSGEVCTCPSRALIDESIYDAFMERALKRVAQIKLGE